VAETGIVPTAARASARRPMTVRAGRKERRYPRFVRVVVAIAALLLPACVDVLPLSWSTAADGSADASDAPNDARDAVADGSLEGGDADARVDASFDGGDAAPILIFRTDPQPGNFGMSLGAARRGSTALCEAAATSEGIDPVGRSFVAILCAGAGDNVDSLHEYGFPQDRPIKTPPGMLPSGMLVADSWADLLDGPRATLLVLGVVSEAFWTGCISEGEAAANCEAWTVSSNSEFGRVGHSASEGPNWIGWAPGPCDGRRPILCLAW
jgi:hypothetical protein